MLSNTLPDRDKVRNSIIHFNQGDTISRGSRYVTAYRDFNACHLLSSQFRITSDMLDCSKNSTHAQKLKYFAHTLNLEDIPNVLKIKTKFDFSLG